MRVPPEIIFDCDLGDIFVIRVAGNVYDDDVFGSIEYAIEHFHVPLVVVMGHEPCGAVKAARDIIKAGKKKKEDLEGTDADAVEKLVAKIWDAVEAARDGQDDAIWLDKAVLENVYRVKKQLTDAVDAKIKTLQEHPLEDEKEQEQNLKDYKNVKILGARYDLDTGEVDEVVRVSELVGDKGGDDRSRDFVVLPPLGTRPASLKVRTGDISSLIQATYEWTVKYQGKPAFSLSPDGKKEAIDLDKPVISPDTDLGVSPGEDKTIILHDDLHDEYITEVAVTYGTYFGAQHIAQLAVGTNEHPLPNSLPKDYSYPYGSTNFSTDLQPHSFKASPWPNSIILTYRGRSRLSISFSVT